MSRDKPKLLKNHQIHFFVNEDEYNLIKARMEFCKITNMSEYATRLLTDGLILIVNDAEVIKDLTREINSIGNNINQIARVANTTNCISAKEVDDLLEMMMTVWQYLRYILSDTQS